MVDKIEMSLDDIIKSTKKNRGTKKAVPRRGGGGGGKKGQQAAAGQKKKSNLNPRSGRIQKRRPGVAGTPAKIKRGNVNQAWKHDLFGGESARGGGPRRGGGRGAGPKLGGRLGGESTKLIISNLDFGVSPQDIKELFGEFGSLKSHTIHYDRSGRSLGTADAVFERKADALRAMKTYNGVPLDGRPMSIQIATSEIPVKVVTPKQIRNQGGGGGARKKAVRGAKGGGGGAAGQKGGRAGGRRSGGGADKKKPTAEELDAELDAYTKSMKN